VWQQGAQNKNFLEFMLNDHGIKYPTKLNRLSLLEIIERGKIQDDKQVIKIRTMGNISINIGSWKKDKLIDKEFDIIEKYTFYRDSFGKWKCIVSYTDHIGFQFFINSITSSDY